ALLGNDLAWQGEIDWPLWLATGESEGTVDDSLKVHARTQLVVPLHPLAYHRALIEGFLRPMNSAATRPFQAALRRGCPASGREQGDLRAGGINRPPDCVGRPRKGMSLGDLWPAGDLRIAVCHGHGRNLMGPGNGLGSGHLTRHTLGVGFDNGTEICAT